jgi:hypothetical protein
MEWPEWWHWDLIFTKHLELRMEEREFSELELRRMLDVAAALKPSRVEGRFVATTRHRGRPWEVVLEPDSADRLLYVVTAYPKLDQP